MTTQTGTTASTTPESRTVSLVQERMLAGLVGWVPVALWFLIVDACAGRPLYSRTVLGSALFRRSAGPPLAEILPDLEMVWMFTWVHALVFLASGGAVARLLGYIEGHPNIGFGILMLFEFFGFGFITVATLFTKPVPHALAAPAVGAAST